MIVKRSGWYCCFLLSLSALSSAPVQGQQKSPEPGRDWYFRDPADDSLAGISLYKAYNLLKSRKARTVVVAVIDNGFDLEHEDLKNNIWTNSKEVPGNGIDDDHNGYIDDIHGWNFRGSKDGSTSVNDQAEATRVYTLWKDIYDNKDTAGLSREKKVEWLEFQNAKKEYLERSMDPKASAEDRAYYYNPAFNARQGVDSPDNINQRYYGIPVGQLPAELSHGTHVAGIIAAERNDGKGIDGIADHVLVMPIVATTGGGDERDKDVANAIFYAVDNGAQIINMSFSKKYSPYKERVDEAVRYAELKNVLIFHAAGNSGDNDDTAGYYPTGLYSDGKKAGNLITVGWSRPKFDYRLAHPNSNYGKTQVDLFAPGSDIYSLVPVNAYAEKSGSSMSTPMVSGVAALLFSYFPSLTAADVKDILMKSVYIPHNLVNRPGSTDKVEFNSLSVSGGIVNAYQAVIMAIRITQSGLK
jgi:subtilisin family serine protease